MFFQLVSLFCVFFTVHCEQAQDFKALVRDTIPFRQDGKIEIPEHVKHVKLDIGLSYNAPQAHYWLTHESDLIVFGFEPNPAAVDSIRQGAVKRHSSHGDPLDVKYIGRSFFLIPCALGPSGDRTIPFYITSKDCGCSSMYQPKDFAVERIIEVPVFTLANFFDLFPFDTHPVIDYIKIDAQGADLDIVKSAGRYLAERVVYITLEAENGQYANTVNSERDIDEYMRGIGFVKYKSHTVVDPTYFNPRYAQYIRKNKIVIYQS